MFNKSGWICCTDASKLKECFNKELIAANFGVISLQEHFFTPFGYSALWLLSESHFAIHTFPEENKTYWEITSCVKKQFDNFLFNFSKIEF